MDINYDEIFGVETVQEETAGEEVQEVAEPADAEENAGEEEQEIAEPAEVSESGSEETADDKKQTPEERAIYANARRKAEAEAKAKYDAMLKEENERRQKEFDEKFKRLGLSNPYNQKPITNEKELDEYQTAYLKDQKQKIIQKSGLSEEEFNKFISELPEVREARETKLSAEKTLKGMRAQADKIEIDRQIAAIGKLDPSIKSIADFVKMENFQEFYQKVQQGLSFEDAYKLTHLDKLQAQAAQTAKQAAINAVTSKEHLAPTKSRGAGAVTVPESVKAEYRQLLPDATDAEIQRHYNAYLKART